MKNTRYKRTLAATVVVWFAFALTAGALNVFRNGSQRLGVAVAIAASTPILLFAIWFAASKRFREATTSFSPQTLTIAETLRIGGLTFVLLYLAGRLPGIFALPAGLGDMAIGVTAPLIAARFANPEHRTGFIVWQLLGMLDLVTAVALGTTAAIIRPGSDMTLMTVLPLSLIPTFFVPLYLMFHVVNIAQAKRWKKEPQARAIGGPIESAA
jgi:hypothetical protein